MKSKPVDTKTKSKIATGFDFIGTKQDHLPAKVEKKPEPTAKEKIDLRTAGANKTKAAVGKIKPSAKFIDKYSQIDHDEEDIISNEKAREIAGLTQDQLLLPSQKTQNLPAVITRELAAAGKVVPEWHMVKHLPGYLSSGIRAIGRKVFEPFTKTPIENIQVLANVQGQGPNTQTEINSVVNYLLKKGVRSTDAELYFSEKIPNYSASVKIFKAGGHTFFVVKDFAGAYIYSWPSSTEKKLLESHSISFKDFYRVNTKKNI